VCTCISVVVVSNIFISALLQGKQRTLFLTRCCVFVFFKDNMVKSNIDKKFSAHYDAVEAELKSSTVGKCQRNRDGYREQNTVERRH